MGIHTHIQWAGDTCFCTILADRLGDSKNMGFGKGTIKGGAPVPGCAKTDTLASVIMVWFAGIVSANQKWNVSDKFRWYGLTC